MSDTKARGLLNRTDAADYLSVSVSSLSRLVAAKEVPFVKVLGATRYAICDLDAYIERLRRTA